MTTVETTSGQLRGVQETGYLAFRGIPFARPPVGPLRFRPPQPPEPWSGARDATRFAGAAPQTKADLGRFMAGFGVGEQSEDCLTLNVATPATDGAGRPVLFWIHGGAFTIGAGSQRMYDPGPLVLRGDVVVVTTNYRLGALGFLHLDTLGGPEFGATSNAALLDQIAALQWVRENVAGFGGDPDNVTIFGESAGGFSVGTLLGTPGAQGLFRRAIAQSGAAHRVNSAEQATEVAVELLEELSLSPGDAGRLRELPAEVIVEAQLRLTRRWERGGWRRAFCPVVDGRVLPEHPLDAIRAGLSREVSVMAGATRDEWKLFGLMDPQAAKLDDQQLLARVEKRAPGHGQRLVDAYRAARAGDDPRPSTPPELFFAFETDRVFRMPVIRLLEAQHVHQAQTYGYLMTWESPLAGGSLGACHGIDVPFVFGNVGKKGAEAFAGSGPEAEQLRDRIMDAWLGFARSGDPSHPDLAAWPPYDEERRATMILDAECAVEEDPLSAEHRAWDGVL